MAEELVVGQKRTFSINDNTYVIKEILDNPTISMEWKWDDSICPHCKEKITRTMNHDFYRIEVLVNEKTDLKDLKREDIILLGDTTDGRRMMFPIEKYNEVLGKSQDFKKFIKQEVKDIGN